MRKRISLLLLCSAALFAREEATRDFRKSVALPAGRSLRIDHSQGNIVIHARPGDQVEIAAGIRCSADTAQEAHAAADQIQIRVDESAAGVSIRTEYPRNSFFSGRHNVGYTVSYDITMPETAPLEVRSRFGSVEVSGLHANAVVTGGNGNVSFSAGRGSQRIESSFGKVMVDGNDGDVTVVTTNGDVTARDITGALDIRDRFGKIQVTNAGKTVNVNGGNGDVEVTNASGIVTIANSFGRVLVSLAKSNVTVQNQNGSVEATDVTGAADLHTSFNPVRFARIGKAVMVHASNSSITGDTVGESATVETSFGAIDLRGVKGGVRATAGNSSIRLSNVGGEVFAKTSFNGITVEDVGGPITAENGNGSVTVAARAGKSCQPISVHTSFGPIRVTVPPGAGYNVTAKTSFGRVNSQPEISVSGQISGGEITGKIHGGGCDLRLLNQNGDINIMN